MKPTLTKRFFFVAILSCAILTAGSLPARQTRVGGITVQPNNTQSNAAQPNVVPLTGPTRANAPSQPIPAPPKPEVSERDNRSLPLSVPAVPETAVSQQATRPATSPQAAAQPAENATGDKTPPGGLHRAMELYFDGSFDQSKEVLEETCRNNPDLPPPGIFLAQFAANAKQENRVRHWLDLAAWEYPDDPEAYVLLADFAVTEGRLTEAKTLVEKGLSLVANIETSKERVATIEMLIDSVQGRICQMWGDWSSAREHFEKLLAKDSENPDLLARLGFVAAHQGQYDDAIAYYQKAIAAGAKLPSPKLMISQIADQQGKTEIADKYFTEALQATDIEPESIRIAVQIQLRRGNIKDAETYLARAVKAEPNNLDNLLLAGTIDLFKKDYAAAEKQFQKAILIAPNNYGAMHGLALALAELGNSLNKERALTYAKNNVQNSGESPDAVATLAWVFFKSDKMLEAEYFGNFVIASGELTPLNAYFLAEIMAARNQPDKALILAKIATASKNDFMKRAEAEALLKKLEGTTADIRPADTSPPTVSEKEPSAPTTGTGNGIGTTAPIRIPGTGARN